MNTVVMQPATARSATGEGATHRCEQGRNGHASEASCSRLGDCSGDASRVRNGTGGGRTLRSILYLSDRSIRRLGDSVRQWTDRLRAGVPTRRSSPRNGQVSPCDAVASTWIAVRKRIGVSDWPFSASMLQRWKRLLYPQLHRPHLPRQARR
jgi:hypothetical protein